MVCLFLKIEGIQLMMDSETGRSKGYGFISVIKASFAPVPLTSFNHRSFKWFVLCPLKVCRRRMCKEGLGAAERLRVGRPAHEGGTRDGALGLVNGQLLPGQRRARENRHRPRHHRATTADGPVGRRFALGLFRHSAKFKPCALSFLKTFFPH